MGKQEETDARKSLRTIGYVFGTSFALVSGVLGNISGAIIGLIVVVMAK